MDIHCEDELPFRLAVANGCLAIVKFFVKNDCYFECLSDEEKISAFLKGHISTIMFLAEQDLNFECILESCISERNTKLLFWLLGKYKEEFDGVRLNELFHMACYYNEQGIAA